MREWLRTVHTLLAQHGWRSIFCAEAGWVRRTEVLRAGVAAAVVHLGLVDDIRQKALVAVLIWST